MKTYRFSLKIQSAFGTPLSGDTLFGQLCWSIVHQFGEQKLTQLLQNYHSQPFVVISDAFPKGFLPLPTLPSYFWEKEENADRKKLKKKQWINTECLQQAVKNWQILAKSEKELVSTLYSTNSNINTFKIVKNQPHNSLNRQTQTTGKGEFAPYSTSQTWYYPDAEFDIYIVIDENQISAVEINQLLENIGKFGFGRDASIGLGKFSIIQYENIDFSTPENANTYLTLANCAPQNLDLDNTRCFYQVTTRFGRHGDIKALSQNPFKKPIILAKTAAIFTPLKWQKRDFIGNGLSDVSYVQKSAVHQGYAPVIPVAIEFSE